MPVAVLLSINKEGSLPHTHNLTHNKWIALQRCVLPPQPRTCCFGALANTSRAVGFDGFLMPRIDNVLDHSAARHKKGGGNKGNGRTSTISG